MHKGKSQAQAQKILELEARIKYLERQLEYKDSQLVATEMKLSNAQMWSRVFKERYLALLTENADLAAINTALKRKNSSLESTAKAFRAIIINIKRKEM